MYQRYQEQWITYKNEFKITEEFNDLQLMKFFKVVRSKYAPSTLQVIYACLNAYFIDKFGKNLNTLPRLTRYLKSQTHLYVTKKIKCFSAEQIHAILSKRCEGESHQNTSLGVIVALLYYGLLRCSEYLDIKVKDVQLMWDGKVEVTFNHPRKRRNDGFKYWIPSVYEDLFQRYVSELKKNVDKKSRFLKNFNKKSGRRVQNTDRNTVNNAVGECCKLLGISKEDYMSHAFRRSAATNLADAGVGLTNLKRHG